MSKDLSINRQKICDLEDKLLEFPQVELDVKHYFAHGTYTRVLTIPKDTILTGKIHRHSCINIIAQGKIMAVSDEGEYEIQAPHIFVSGANVKKAGYTLEDTIWVNVHPWNGLDNLEEIEETLIISDKRNLSWHG